ncbi:MAG: tetratricopeptide repeat protein [Planctomycetota bacterium]
MLPSGFQSTCDHRLGVVAARFRSDLGACVRVLVYLVWGFACGLTSVGCGTLKTSNESILQVTNPHDALKAARLTRQGIHALSKQKIEVAAKHFRDAVKADFTYGPAHNNLGLLHYEQGNLYQAVLAFEHAHEFLPDDPATAYNLALTLESGGRVMEAREYYEIASAMEPANPHYLGNLVRLRVRLGERDDVIREQLQDLALIETRPEWRRWADTQLAIAFNDALDRGPSTPDLETSANETRKADRSKLRTKIIDLTPVRQVSMEQSPVPKPNEPEADSIMELLPGGPDLTPPREPAEPPPAVVELDEEPVEDLSIDEYYRRP